MRYSEQFMEHIEYAFHAFCKIVLRHEAMNAWRDLKRKVEREISLDYLMSERYFEPSVMDSYFEKQDKPTVFLVLGKEVIVDDERLARALSRLPKLRQEVLLLGSQEDENSKLLSHSIYYGDCYAIEGIYL